MEKDTIKLINKLGNQMLKLQQPIQLLAICSGGRIVAQELHKYFIKNKINPNYYEVWTNIVNGKSSIWKTDFPNKAYEGTAIIVEDVIWSGTQLPPVIEMLKKHNPEKKFFIASLLDCNKKADFFVYR